MTAHGAGIRVITSLLLSVPLMAAPGAAQQPARDSGGTFAQRLVEETRRRHPELAGVELAATSARGCAVIAATDRSLIGEPCGDDERQPMATGEPSVEEPSSSDPVYDITQALHDSAGRLVGTLALDITPAPGQKRDAVVAFARAVLKEVEAQIPSRSRLDQ